MSVTAPATAVSRFRIEVPEEQISELHRRIAATRWPSAELVGDRSQGVQLETIQELAAGPRAVPDRWQRQDTREQTRVRTGATLERQNQPVRTTHTLERRFS
jgi:hypothetical protein